MNEIETAWVAGVLEGEGSFLFRSHKLAVISCSMTDKDIIDRLHKLLGGNVYDLGRRLDHHKDVFKIQICGRAAVEIMRSIRPHMGVRRSEQIDKVLALHDTRRENVEKSKRVWDDNLALALECYRTSGQSLKQVAKQYGVSNKTLGKYAKIDKPS